jgi:hypothetical protein
MIDEFAADKDTAFNFSKAMDMLLPISSHGIIPTFNLSLKKQPGKTYLNPIPSTREPKPIQYLLKQRQVLRTALSLPASFCHI